MGGARRVGAARRRGPRAVLSLLVVASCARTSGALPVAPLVAAAELPAPEAARTWFAEGLLAAERGDVDGARRAAAWVTRLDGARPAAWAAAAEILVVAGLPDEAAGVATRACDGDDALRGRLVALGLPPCP